MKLLLIDNPKETSLMTHPDASMKMYDKNIDLAFSRNDRKVESGYFKINEFIIQNY